LKDLDQLTDSDNGFDGINIVAQLLWQAYKTRFDTGIASLSLFAILLGANFISALYAITSASRSACYFQYLQGRLQQPVQYNAGQVAEASFVSQAMHATFRAAS